MERPSERINKCVRYPVREWDFGGALAAEGKFLKAHKVVLSTCSSYFAALLSQQYDKHPIFILKDVKFQELRAMMDYMCRGEVNFSQDQLAALLKAAKSLQIKGLSDSRSAGSSGGLGSGQKPTKAAHKPLSVTVNSSVPPSNTSTAITSVSTGAIASQAIISQQGVVGVSGASGVVGNVTSAGLSVTKKTDSVSSNAKLEIAAEQEMDNENGLRVITIINTKQS